MRIPPLNLKARLCLLPTHTEPFCIHNASPCGDDHQGSSFDQYGRSDFDNKKQIKLISPASTTAVTTTATTTTSTTTSIYLFGFVIWKQYLRGK